MIFSEETAGQLWQALLEKDRFTGEHSTRVSELAAEFALSLGWDEEETRWLKAAALLHDIGKLDIPDEVFKKIRTGITLSEEDREVIRSHTGHTDRLEGYENIPAVVQDTLKYHHERFDGTGYPHGLAGDEIPTGVKIIALADYYDSALITREHKTPVGMKPMEQEDILRILVENAANRFDPELLAKFIHHLLHNESKIAVAVENKTGN